MRNPPTYERRVEKLKKTIDISEEEFERATKIIKKALKEDWSAKKMLGHLQNGGETENVILTIKYLVSKKLEQAGEPREEDLEQ